jgi:hypothetical protein
VISEVYGVRLLKRPAIRVSIVIVLLAIVGIFRVLQFVTLAHDERWALDLSYYWTAASRLLDGQSIYSAQQLSGPYFAEGQDGFLYPPPFAVVVTPIAVLFPTDYRAAGWLWAAIGACLIAWSVIVVSRAEGLLTRFRDLPGGPAPYLVAAALILPPVIGELTVGNVHAEILALLSLAWLGIRRGDSRGDLMVGIGVGAATLLKVFPALIIVWLFFSGRIRAGIWVVVAMAVISLATLPFTGLQPWFDYPKVLANMGPILDIHDSVSPTIWLMPLLGFDAARGLVSLIGIALVVYAARRGPAAIGFAIAVTASVLVAPSVFHHYLTVLILPLLLGISAGVPVRWIVLVYFLLWGGQQAAFGEWAWVLSRVPQTLGWLVLVFALLWFGRAHGPGGQGTHEPRRAARPLAA